MYAPIFSALTFTPSQTQKHACHMRPRYWAAWYLARVKNSHFYLPPPVHTYEIKLSFLQILLLSVTAVCHVHHTWPRHPLTLPVFERDTPVTDRWMFFCCLVKTLVNSSSCLITPQGRKRLTESVPHIPAAGMFSVWTLGVWWHHHASYPGGSNKVSCLGGFWSPKNANSFWAKVTVMMHRSVTHWMNLLMYVCNGFCGLLSETSSPWLWSQTSVVNWLFLNSDRPWHSRPVEFWISTCCGGMHGALVQCTSDAHL